MRRCYSGGKFWETNDRSWPYFTLASLSLGFALRGNVSRHQNSWRLVREPVPLSTLLSPRSH